MTTRIAEHRAMVVWNTIGHSLNPSGDVVVHDKADARRFAETHRSSMGACCAGWCTGSHPRDTPAGLFASIVLNAPDPVSRTVLQAWLEQFGKIDTCEWARLMLAEMADHDRRQKGAA